MEKTQTTKIDTRRTGAQAIALILTALFMLAGLAMTTASDADAQSTNNGTVCIESNFVQNHPKAATMAVGSQITTANGANSYLIITGGPTCTFNCVGGFDIDCDGKLGDFCPVEFDRNSVRGAGQCLDWLARDHSRSHGHGYGHGHSHGDDNYRHTYSAGYLYRQAN